MIPRYNHNTIIYFIKTNIFIILGFVHLHYHLKILKKIRLAHFYYIKLIKHTYPL